MAIVDSNINNNSNSQIRRNFNNADTGASIGIDSNVTIQEIDSNHKLLRESHIHNKATQYMVMGMLEFLRGAYTPTDYNPNIEQTAINEAQRYIPTHIRFGTVGVKLDNRQSDKPVFIGIDYSQLKTPTFNDYQLQQDITSHYQNITDLQITFDTTEIANYNDNNNSMGLLLTSIIPPGKLIGVGSGEDRKYFIDNNVGDSNGWVFYNSGKGMYQGIFTEVGLYSGNGLGTNQGLCLARVLLDGELSVDNDGNIVFENESYNANPITQRDDVTVVIQWKIGLASLGHNDTVMSGANAIDKITTADTTIYDNSPDDGLYNPIG